MCRPMWLVAGPSSTVESGRSGTPRAGWSSAAADRRSPGSRAPRCPAGAVGEFDGADSMGYPVGGQCVEGAADAQPAREFPCMRRTISPAPRATAKASLNASGRMAASSPVRPKATTPCPLRPVPERRGRLLPALRHVRILCPPGATGAPKRSPWRNSDPIWRDRPASPCLCLACWIRGGCRPAPGAPARPPAPDPPSPHLWAR